ncbi:MAG: dTDP-4-dehydrorhamnose reductase [Bacteroidetes bacterium]|nr:dTDP-4-dehydrorhamnose reductase [Bacteroidota bacterium]
MKNILVTGSYGQLGNELHELADLGLPYHFIWTDADTLDITDKEALKNFVKKNPIDLLINCAAYNAVDKAEEEKEIAELINTKAVRLLAEICKENGAKYIHVSTDYVFNGKTFLPYKETDTPNANSAYGISKLKGEEEALKYDNALIIRTAWLYSSYGKNFVKTMLRLGAEKESLGVIFDQVGTPTYAFDLANAIIKIINHINDNKKDFNPGIYNFSNEGVCSWYDFAVSIMKSAGLSCKVLPIETKDYPLPANRPFYSVLNKNKIRSAFNIEIPHWKESLDKCIRKIKKS